MAQGASTPPPTAAATQVNPHAALGPYTPVSDVIEHSQMVYDIKDITTAAKAGEWATAKSIYTGGRYSCKSSTSQRTLQGFVSSSTATAKLTGEAFFTGFTSGTGPASPKWSSLGSGRLGLAIDFWDALLTAALDGTGDFAGTSADVVSMRQYAVTKGILGVLTMYTTHEMESAISKFNAGQTADTQAPHAWDEGWAFLYGSMGSGASSAWEFSKKRDSDFTVNSAGADVAGTASASTLLDNYFRAGQAASRTGGSIANMVAAAKNIYRMLALSSIRAALKYAYMTQKGAYDAAAHMEGYAYFLAAAGWVEQASPGTGTAVLALMTYTTTPAANLYCNVKAALIPAYDNLGLSCEMVGTYKKFGTSGYVAPDCAALGVTIPACPTGVAALSMGTTSEAALATTTSAGTNLDCGYTLPGMTSEEDNTSAAWRTTIGMMSCCVAGALFA
jgi:hypothetical protein